MLTDISIPLEEYFNQFQDKKYRNFPTELINKMQDYLIRKYEENFLSIMESTLLLLRGDEDALSRVLNEVNKIWEELNLYNSIVEHNTTIGQYKDMIMKGIENLIKILSENEDKFWKEVLNSASPNFQITTYYSLYLEFLTKTYVRLKELKVNPNVKTADCPKKDVLNVVNSLVGILGIPLIMYIRENKIYPYISELIGLLLYATRDEVLLPSRSLGYYLFSRIHGSENG